MSSLTGAVFGIVLAASSAVQAPLLSTCPSDDGGALAKMGAALHAAAAVLDRHPVAVSRTLHVVDVTMAAVAIGAGAAAIAGVGAPIAAAAGTAALAWSVGRSAATLLSRAVHHQTLNPIADASARGAWIGVATGALGAGAFAADARIAADLVIVRRDLLLARTLRTAAMIGGAGATTNSAAQTISDWNRMGTADRVAAIGQVAFWSGVTLVDAVGNTSPGASPSSSASSAPHAAPAPGTTIRYAGLQARVSGPDGGVLAAAIEHVNDVGGTTNCVSTSVAADLTLGGVPAVAKASVPPQLTGSSYHMTPTESQAYADAFMSPLTETLAERYHITPRNIVDETELPNLASVANWMDAHGVTRGIVTAYVPVRGGGGVGHAFNVVRVGDVVYAVDAQSRIVVPVDTLSASIRPTFTRFRFWPTAAAPAPPGS